MSLWNPRAGSLGKLSSYAVIGHKKLVNIRIVEIRQVEGNKLFVAGLKNPFRRVNPRRFEEIQPATFAQGAFVQLIERPTSIDLLELPRDIRAGALYAEQVRG